ncbi:MAG: S-layer homology domain-containing protein [Dethiosulfatibacter sp.]|nr:S-layer homology domain-containing protein [Dethiosulfatibacter sp.]
MMKKTVSLILTICIILTLIISGPYTFAESTEDNITFEMSSEWARAWLLISMENNLVSENSLNNLKEMISREEFCELVMKLYTGLGGKDFPINKMLPFSDTTNIEVIRAYHLGIVEGTGEGVFNPHGHVTREQMAVMLHRLMDSLGIYPITDMQYLDFADESDISEYAKSSIQLLYKVGVINGLGNQLIAPKSHATHEEAIVMSARLFSEFEDFERVVSDELFDLALNRLMPTDKNYMFSPLSIKMALAMAANGANGATLEEILKTLNISDLATFNDLALNLIQTYSENESVKLNIANSIWLNKDHHYEEVSFAESYQNVIEEYYEGYSQVVDNANAVDAINGWVNEKTNGKIPELIDNSEFLAFLANAIYFKGDWAVQFDEMLTADDTFTDRNNTESQMQFMNQTGYFEYFEENGLQMVKLPYKDGKTSMYIALTDDRQIDLTQKVTEMASKRVQLSIPKFEVKFEVELSDMLKEMGIVTAFKEYDADLKGMFTEISENTFISSVVHKTFINVDEFGTEAAAVTGISVGVTSMPTDEPVVFKADRPFTYIIRDDVNNEILFMGEFAFAE